MAHTLRLFTFVICASLILVGPVWADPPVPVFTLVNPQEWTDYDWLANIHCGGMCSVQGATCDIQFLDPDGDPVNTATGTATSAVSWSGILYCEVDLIGPIPWPVSRQTDTTHTKVKIIPDYGTVSGVDFRNIQIHD
jgi:hypothetical protein